MIARTSTAIPRRTPPPREAGIASVFVLAVLFLLVAFLVASSRVVIQLKQEIHLVEERQLEWHAANGE